MRILQRLMVPGSPDLGLLFARLAGALLLLTVHGLPKLAHWRAELAHIDDPLGLGPQLTLACALVAEIVCPLLIAAGLFTRLACLPVVFLLAVSMVLVHPDWTLEQGQFGWLLIIVFGTLALAGGGRYSADARLGVPGR